MNARTLPTLLAVAALLCVAAVPAALAGDAVAGAMVRDFDRAAEKLTALAEAIPAEDYDWRPAEGVRSVSETFMHVAQANFYLASALGAETPEDMPENLEAVTDKEKVTAWLGKSMKHARKGLEMAGDADMGAEKELFGHTMTVGDAAFILLTHNHEHLGQAIAYARSNGVVPPWSQPPAEEEQAEDEEGDDAM